MSKTVPPRPDANTLTVTVGGKTTNKLRRWGGSDDDKFNNAIINSGLQTMWFPAQQSPEAQSELCSSLLAALGAFKPQDEIEAMIAVQAISMHHTSMECSRRAMLRDQPYEFAQGFRKAGANASRVFTELLGALDRKRGKHRQQLVRVERVTVQAGAQAVVGIVQSGGAGGATGKTEGEPHAPPAELAHDPAVSPGMPAMRSEDAERERLPVARDDQRTVQDARRQQHRSADR